MDEPVIAGKEPAVMDLEPGDYYWCACGRSGNQPWCDGSHEGTGHSPVKVRVEARRRGALCLCKRTGDPPWCDGAHRNLD